MRKRCRRRVWSTSINPIAHAIAGACIADTDSLNQLRLGELKALEAMKTGEAGFTYNDKICLYQASETQLKIFLAIAHAKALAQPEDAPL